MIQRLKTFGRNHRWAITLETCWKYKYATTCSLQINIITYDGCHLQIAILHDGCHQLWSTWLSWPTWLFFPIDSFFPNCHSIFRFTRSSRVLTWGKLKNKESLHRRKALLIWLGQPRTGPGVHEEMSTPSLLGSIQLAIKKSSAFCQLRFTKYF